jgi:ferredoxin, 2Fe-2S
MPRVTFLPEGITVECAAGERVFDLGRRAGVTIETTCVGKATCGLCRVKVIAGEDNLTPYNEAEEKHLGNVYHLTRVRLSCQAIVQGGDVTVQPAPRRKRKNDKTK